MCNFVTECGHRYGSYPTSSWFNSDQSPLFFSFTDVYTIDWVVIFFLTLLLPLLFTFFRWGLLLYGLFLRPLNYTTRAPKINTLWYTLVFTTLPLINVLVTWNSPTICVFADHLIFNSFILQILTYVLFISPFLATPLLYTDGCRSGVKISTVALLFLFVTLNLAASLVLMSTKPVTLVFALELFNMVIFALFVSTLSTTRNGSVNTAKQIKISSSPLIVFFWINALSSLFLFTLILFSDTNITSSFNLAVSWFELTKTNGLASTFIVLIFAFKLGLPPFITWKVQLFTNAPSLFIYLYNIPYTVLILLTSLALLATLTDWHVTELQILIFSITLVSTLFTMLLLDKSYSFSLFFAVSTALTTVLLWFLTAQTTYYSLELQTVHLLTYTLTYSLTLLLVFLITPNTSMIGSYSLNALLTSSKQTLFNENRLSLFIFIAIASFAGLPVLSSFFIKLNLLTGVTSTNLTSALTLTPLFTLLLLSIIFYFRAVRFVLFIKQPQLFLRKFTTFSRSNNTSLVVTAFITTGWLLYPDAVLYLFALSI